MVDEEDLCTLKIHCKGKETVGKTNNGINIEKIIIGLKIKNKTRKEKKGKLSRSAKAQCTGRSL